VTTVVIFGRVLFLLAGLLPVLALSQPARAQGSIMDPAFEEFVTNSCPANCASAALALDPVSGLTTVEYIFNSTIPSVIAGDVDITEFGTSTVGDLIRFEDNSGKADAFIFSDIGGGQAADVGIPAPYPGLTNAVTIAETSNGDSALYIPTSGQPGFCGTCGSKPAYELLDSLDVPEPGTLSILGSGCLLLFRFTRRRKRG
jgi:hypothetical protein